VIDTRGPSTNESESWGRSRAPGFDVPGVVHQIRREWDDERLEMTYVAQGPGLYDDHGTALPWLRSRARIEIGDPDFSPNQTSTSGSTASSSRFTFMLSLCDAGWGRLARIRDCVSCSFGRSRGGCTRFARVDAAPRIGFEASYQETDRRAGARCER